MVHGSVFVDIARAARAIAAPDARVAIAGVSGSGKTTLATRLSSVAGIPHTELDALPWGARVERAEFMNDVRELVRTPNDVKALLDAVSTTQD